jgi:hypothetical protein
VKEEFDPNAKNYWRRPGFEKFVRTFTSKGNIEHMIDNITYVGCTRDTDAASEVVRWWQSRCDRGPSTHVFVFEAGLSIYIAAEKVSLS